MPTTTTTRKRQTPGIEVRHGRSCPAATGDPATITECGEQILSAQNDPTLPAYAGYGELESEDVLMMGFVYSGADAGPLDKFMLWIWPRDDCSIPSEYQFGKIKP